MENRRKSFFSVTRTICNCMLHACNLSMHMQFHIHSIWQVWTCLYIWLFACLHFNLSVPASIKFLPFLVGSSPYNVHHCQIFHLYAQIGATPPPPIPLPLLFGFSFYFHCASSARISTVWGTWRWHAVVGREQTLLHLASIRDCLSVALAKLESQTSHRECTEIWRDGQISAAHR